MGNRTEEDQQVDGLREHIIMQVTWNVCHRSHETRMLSPDCRLGESGLVSST